MIDVLRAGRYQDIAWLTHPKRQEVPQKICERELKYLFRAKIIWIQMNSALPGKMNDSKLRITIILCNITVSHLLVYSNLALDPA